MKRNETKNIPAPVLGRMTRYLAQVRAWQREGKKWISSREIADVLGLTASTVRQDLSYIDFRGRTKMGYELDGLERALRDVLGADYQWSIVIVGAGNLGRALALHEDFPRHGFKICCVFDIDKRKIGKRLGRLMIRSMEDLDEVICCDKVDIGVIAVPPEAAQEVADRLVAAGIKGLLNLALTHVSAPPNVTVMDARFVATLQQLAHSLKARKGKKKNETCLEA